MKKKKNILFLLLIIFSVIGVTYAYYSYSESFNNDFEVGMLNVVIEEIFEEGTCLGNGQLSNENYCVNAPLSKEVFVVNYENTDAVVRLNYNEYLIDNSDAEYGTLTNNYDNIIVKEWTDDFLYDWYYYDGWYYYTKVLPAGSDVKVLNSIYLQECCFVGDYNLDFNIEAIQATQNAVDELWGDGIIILDNGNLVFGFES